MNREQMRIAIAEVCGRCTSGTYTMTDGWETAVCSGCGKNPYHADHEPPHYPSDLNAMHEAEKAIPETHEHDYIAWLSSVVAREPGFKPICMATAEQRAEAFLKTVDRWVGDGKVPESGSL